MRARTRLRRQVRLRSSHSSHLVRLSKADNTENISSVLFLLKAASKSSDASEVGSSKESATASNEPAGENAVGRGHCRGDYFGEQLRARSNLKLSWKTASRFKE